MLLRPYLRRACSEWRGPWLIRERRLVDYLVVHVGSGEGRFSVDGKVFPVRAGDVVWIPPDTPHVMEGFAPRMQVSWAHFDLVWDARRSAHQEIGLIGMRDLGPYRHLLHPPFAAAPIAGWRGRLPLANGGSVQAVLRRLAVADLSGRNPLMLTGLMYQLIAEIARGCAAGDAAPARWRAVLEAGERLVSGPETPLDVAAMARGAGMSGPHFRRLFRQAHGRSARELHAHARLQRAAELVMHSSEPIGRIAARLGFTGLHNFARAFRREVGCSPREWRRRTRG